MTTAGSPSVDAAPRTEVVVPRVGPIRVSGHLTRQGADLVRGTVETARRTGSPVVVVDLAGVRTADDAGLDALHTLRDTLSGRGTRLLLRNEPGVTPA
jgi:anti-anti-sigma regulatory factor